MARERKGATVQLREIVFAGYERERALSFEAPARAARIAAFACFVGVAAQLAVPLPITPVPLTMQTLFVVLAGIVLGARNGCYAMLTYVALGAAGAPVFANFSGGLHVLAGPTGGYIVSFPAAAAISGYISERFRGGRPAIFLASLSGLALILAAGSSYLMMLGGLSLSRALSLGALPFVAGELVKAAIATFLSAAQRPAGASRV